MIETFAYEALPSRVRFGRGTIRELAAEVERLGARRALVLTTPALRSMWEGELAAMRVRIKAMREQLQAKLQAAGVKGELGFITRQKGMFSYSGLNAAQMQRLRSEFGIYGVDSGRICVAALNAKNIDAVVAAIASVS